MGSVGVLCCSLRHGAALERRNSRDHGCKHLAALRPIALRKYRHAVTGLNLCVVSLGSFNYQVQTLIEKN